jgi:hypothetical protein
MVDLTLEGDTSVICWQRQKSTHLSDSARSRKGVPSLPSRVAVNYPKNEAYEKFLRTRRVR